MREHKRAIAAYEQALALCQASGDPQQEQDLLGNLGTVYSSTGQWETATGYYERALALARQARDRPGEGVWLLDMALVLDEQGQRAEAVQRMQAAEGVLSQAGHSAAAKAREWLERWEAK
jgi:tetratricopeptide (TPR) repeat protein